MTDTDTAPEAETTAAESPAAAPELGADLANVDAGQLAALVAGASDEQLAEGMSDPAARQSILDEVFRRMTEHLDADKAKGTDAVLHWKITDKPGGGEDTYEVTLKDGAVSVSTEPDGRAARHLHRRPGRFPPPGLRRPARPVLFMAGKLKIEGDLMFASQVATMFKIPQAGA